LLCTCYFSIFDFGSWKKVLHARGIQGENVNLKNRKHNLKVLGFVLGLANFMHGK
jgi:hypothetical protein